MMQISVIIRTELWSERLRANLVSLAQQTLGSSDFEVLLVDSSLERLEDKLAHMTLPYSWKVIKQSGDSPGTGFNRGVESACGQSCLFLGEDIVADPGQSSDQPGRISGQPA